VADGAAEAADGWIECSAFETARESGIGRNEQYSFGVMPTGELQKQKQAALESASSWVTGQQLREAGVRPYLIQPLTPRPSSLPSAETSTVTWTAGYGAVSAEKKFWIRAEKTSGVGAVEYLMSGRAARWAHRSAWPLASARCQTGLPRTDHPTRLSLSPDTLRMLSSMLLYSLSAKKSRASSCGTANEFEMTTSPASVRLPRRAPMTRVCDAVGRRVKWLRIERSGSGWRVSELGARLLESDADGAEGQQVRAGGRAPVSPVRLRTAAGDSAPWYGPGARGRQVDVDERGSHLARERARGDSETKGGEVGEACERSGLEQATLPARLAARAGNDEQSARGGRRTKI
jgi:hypothetical protein